MKTLENSFEQQTILSVTAHPDDLEVQHLGALDAAQTAYAYIATDGEASTVNLTGRSLCRPCQA